VNAWEVLLGASILPEFGGGDCCQTAPGGLILLADIALLHLLLSGDTAINLETARTAPVWRRGGRAVHVLRTYTETCDRPTPDRPAPAAPDEGEIK
jgi:hypothetical protein